MYIHIMSYHCNTIRTFISGSLLDYQCAYYLDYFYYLEKKPILFDYLIQRYSRDKLATKIKTRLLQNYYKIITGL